MSGNAAEGAVWLLTINPKGSNDCVSLFDTIAALADIAPAAVKTTASTIFLKKGKDRHLTTPPNTVIIIVFYVGCIAEI